MRTVTCVPRTLALATPVALALAMFTAARPVRAQSYPEGWVPPPPTTPAAPLPSAAAYVRNSASFGGEGWFANGDSHTGITTSNSGLYTHIRVVHHGLALEFGTGLSYSQITQNSYPPGSANHADALIAQTDVGIGYAVALADAVAFTPTLAYQIGWAAQTGLGVTSQNGLFHAVTARLPVTFFVSRHVYVEPFVGATYLTGVLGDEVELAAGWSLGVVLL